MTNRARHEPAFHRFAVGKENETAVLTYREAPGTITFVHTEVPPALRSQGLGEELARAGLEYARAQHLTVIPRCPYIAAYLKRHAEFADLADPGAV